MSLCVLQNFEILDQFVVKVIREQSGQVAWSDAALASLTQRKNAGTKIARDRTGSDCLLVANRSNGIL